MKDDVLTKTSKFESKYGFPEALAISLKDKYWITKITSVIKCISLLIYR